MRSFNTLLALTMVWAIAFTGCKKDDDNQVVTQKTKLISSPNNDGYVINSSQPYLNANGTRLEMGWDGGIPTRGFLSFDIYDLIPTSEKQQLVIEKAVLKVYEQNTNMHPFDGEGQIRQVEAYLMNYGELGPEDYNGATIAKCGVIAATGYNVLTEHALDVTNYVKTAYENGSLDYTIQFRLQLTFCTNSCTVGSTLYSSMWCVYSGEEQGALVNDYRPALEITYSWKSK